MRGPCLEIEVEGRVGAGAAERREEVQGAERNRAEGIDGERERIDRREKAD